MEYRVLGPLEIICDGVALNLGGVRQQRVLAGLVLANGQAVGLSRLASIAWGDAAPITAERQVQNRIATLRGMLTAAGAASALTTTPSGYRLSLPPESVDVHAFDQQCRTAASAADPAAALRSALAMWRGPALAGLGGTVLDGEIAALEERRLNTLERCLELELAAGLSVIAELTALVYQRPLRERPVVLLMTALYRAGRQGEALACYRDLTNRLADDLGLDPSAELQALHQRMLRADPALNAHGAVTAVPAAVPTAAPNHLPRAISDFTGRTAAVDKVLALAAADATDVLLIDGMAGAGKTTLAVRVGHLLADRYPAGRLYVDLHGHSEREPVEPATALDSLLRQLGVPAERIPDSLDDRAAMWRAELSGRRALVVLDNAADSAQVLPLLGGGQPGLTLVTSRQRLAGIDGAESLSLDVLPEGEAVALLMRVIGDRVVAEPSATAAVARLCGYLPLALRIAAARLANRPQWSVDDLLRRLRDAHPPLSELGVPGRTVEAAFTLSHRQLGEPARMVFRRLGLHPAGDFGEHVVAAMTDLSLAQARSTLEDLVDAHLLESPKPGRYRLHDLLRDYAAALVEEQEEEPALRMLCGYYLHATASATSWLERTANRPDLVVDQHATSPPTVANLDEARTWLDTERANVLASIRLAHHREWHRSVCLLVRAIWADLYWTTHFADLIVVHKLALIGATALHDRASISSAHNYLASAYWRQGLFDRALAHVNEALRIRREIGDVRGEAATLTNLASITMRVGRHIEALSLMQESLRLWHELEVVDAVAGAHIEIGMVLSRLGRYDESLIALQHGLRLNQTSGKRAEIANAIFELGDLRVTLGNFRVAALLLQRAARMKRSLRNRFGEAEAITKLGSAYLGMERSDRAIACQRRALDMMTEGGLRAGECVVLNDLGVTMCACGRLGESVGLHRRALDQAHEIHYRHEEARAHDGIASAQASSDPAAAREHWFAALELYEDMRLPERHTVAWKLAALDHGQLTHSSVPSANT
jgi:DNA-binding SARP family transcriptional activator/tetratricopeptide (TPR) repeat protein